MLDREQIAEATGKKNQAPSLFKKPVPGVKNAGKRSTSYTPLRQDRY